jgi:hypothetical protein
MKKQINPTIKAHLIRSAFYVVLLLAVCVIPFTLAQSRSRGTAKQSAGQPTWLAPSAAASAFASQASALQKSPQAGQSRAASAAAAALMPGQRSLQIHKSPRHVSGSVLWYNGDFNGVNGLANEDNTSLGSGEFASVYDDFIVPSGPGWSVSAVFSDNLENTNVTGATWEIRQGISEGNGGTLIASGMTMTPVVTDTGRGGFGFQEFMIEVTGLNVSLPPGTYWLNVTPIGDLTGRSFDSNTSGANCVGTPCGNDLNAFFNSNFFGATWQNTSEQGQATDFSMGVEGSISGGGSPTPTPSGTPTCTPGPLWYNGDFNGVNALANEENTSIGSGEYASVYDDFIVPSGPVWSVTSVFSDNLENTNVTGASWEIRTGVSEGNGGILVASGVTVTPVVTPTGRSGFGFTEYMIEVTGLSVSLPPGIYWLNVTPIGDLTGRSFEGTTSGANCVGMPCGNDGNSFFNTNENGGIFFGSTPYDFSMGVNGTAGSGCGSPSPTPTATATATATSPPPSPTIPPRSTPTPRPRPTPPPRP